MTYRLPSLNTLRAFEAAARHLSFRAAATEIGVTSGAVSQQVRKLEQSLGVDLFHRLPHGLLLTVEGEAYLPKITKVFEDLTAATEEIAPDMNGKKFSVGVCPKAAALLPVRWPLNGRSLGAYVRERIETSDVEQVRTGAIDCLVQVGGGAFGQLAVIQVARAVTLPGQDAQFNVICKTGLANCRQTRELILNLSALGQ
ncbi:LysR family transcriptional regulator [uncultured Roseovarius sp.]|uniref:LysR family transcriptional regulator n=1 Tax=uncultured Roseovarius sp. TaxID=293344 RepID=UPI00260EE333|nr:LysR family transcriptional regulator [uncultured Roseovarius sp.]